jgi:hypothetical protein
MTSPVSKKSVYVRDRVPTFNLRFGLIAEAPYVRVQLVEPRSLSIIPYSIFMNKDSSIGI